MRSSSVAGEGASARAHRRRRFWTDADVALLRDLYPDTPTGELARRLGREVTHVYTKAALLGLRKSATYLASPAACRLRRGDNVGASTRFQRGQVPWNAGTHYVAGGRSAETRFKPGERHGVALARWVPIGSLRENADGYIDMKVREAPGARAWRALHRILWEDAYGPVPAGHAVRFRNGDKLDVELANLECVSRVELMRANTVHNLPPALRVSVQMLGQLKRRIRERRERAR